MTKKTFFLLFCCLCFGSLAFKPLRISFFKALPISSKIIGPPKRSALGRELGQASGVTIYNYQEHEKTLNQLFRFNTDDPKKFGLHDGTSHKNLQKTKEYILCLDQGRVIGTECFVVTKDDCVIKETSYRPLKKLDKKIFLPKVQKTDEVVVVIGQRASKNYFHWMCDILPKIEMIQESGLAYDKLYIPYAKLPFQTETLKKLKIDFNKVITPNEHTHLEAKLLIVPVLCSYIDTDIPQFDDHYYPRIARFYQKLFLESTSQQTPYKRLYIARKTPQVTSSYRKLTNEEEFWPLLEAHGFEKIYLEELTVQQQAELFAQAEAIIGNHGAGFTNLVFANPGTKVLEFHHEGFLRDHYCKIAQWLNLEYHFTYIHPETMIQKESFCGAIEIETLREFLKGLKS